MSTILCIRCFRPFSGRPPRKFCSHSCSAIYNNNLRKTNKSCLVCEAAVSTRHTFCSHACCKEHQYINQTLPRIIKGLVSDRGTLKKFLIRNHGYKCSQCHKGKWFKLRLPLELDHKDGNATTNLPSNLRLLCPNCHSITPTWKNKNRGNGRRSRGLRSS
jgi:predicted nucleic acid-binding Zn ribbon protein